MVRRAYSWKGETESEKTMKKVRYIGKEQMDYFVKGNDMDLIPNKIYEVLSEDEDEYDIVDESGENYAYPKSFFNVVEE